MPLLKASLKEAFLIAKFPPIEKKTIMRCTFCGTDQTRSVDTRSIKNGKIVKRRRQCLRCSKRFTTYELVKHD